MTDDTDIQRLDELPEALAIGVEIVLLYAAAMGTQHQIIDLTNVTVEGRPIGSWRISITRTDGLH